MESHSYTYTKFGAGSTVRSHAHDEGQLRIITSGSFNFVVNGEKFEQFRRGGLDIYSQGRRVTSKLWSPAQS